MQMSKMTEIKLTDYSPKVLEQMEEQVLLGLELIGQEAEGNAKDECPLDTGLLRNSIAHALAGEQPSIGKNHKGTAKKAITYKADKPDKNGVVRSGTYTGKTPKKQGEHSVYIGSNVEYAVDVEFNATKKHDTGKAHFLKDAATTHTDQYKEIMKLALKGKTSI
jgi:hypothetical protein